MGIKSTGHDIKLDLQDVKSDLQDVKSAHGNVKSDYYGVELGGCSSGGGDLIPLFSRGFCLAASASCSRGSLSSQASLASGTLGGLVWRGRCDGWGLYLGQAVVLGVVLEATGVGLGALGPVVLLLGTLLAAPSLQAIGGRGMGELAGGATPSEEGAKSKRGQETTTKKSRNLLDTHGRRGSRGEFEVLPTIGTRIGGLLDCIFFLLSASIFWVGA